MTDSIVVLNAGSSSLKLSLYRLPGRPRHDQLLCHGQFSGIGHQVQFLARDPAGNPLVEQSLGALSHADALENGLSWLKSAFPGLHLVAAGHRVVHGGQRFRTPVRVDAGVLAQLRTLVPLAPLHQPHSLAAIEACAKLNPALPQVACFDTAFHHTQPEHATAFALPADITTLGVRRYGFHGLSYEYIASQLPSVIEGPADNDHPGDGRIIVAHLGNGASLCALHGRRSVATTMGFSTLDGVPMSSRCGSLDPGAILFLLQECGMTVSQLSGLLYSRSGLLGLSGISDDLRILLDSRDPAAARAIDVFVYRISREIGSLAAALGGLDALVFTAGIGENAAPIRAAACRQAAWLGVTLDEDRNQSAQVTAAVRQTGAACISTTGSRVPAWVIPTDEDLMIARHTWDLIQKP